MNVQNSNLSPVKSSGSPSPIPLGLSETIKKNAPAIESIKNAAFENQTYILEASRDGPSFTARVSKWMRSIAESLVAFLTRRQPLDPVNTMDSISKSLVIDNSLEGKSSQLLDLIQKKSLQEVYPQLLELRYLVEAKRQDLIDIVDAPSNEAVDNTGSANKKARAKTNLMVLEKVVNQLGCLARQVSPNLQNQIEAALRISKNAAALEKSTNLDQDVIFRKPPDVIGHIDQAGKPDIQDGLSLIQEQTNGIIKLCSDLPGKSIFDPSDNNFAALANLLLERQKTCAKVIKNIDVFMKDTRLTNKSGLEEIRVRVDRIWGQSDFFYKVIERTDEAFRAEGKIITIQIAPPPAMKGEDLSFEESELREMAKNYDAFLEKLSTTGTEKRELYSAFIELKHALYTEIQGRKDSMTMDELFNGSIFEEDRQVLNQLERVLDSLERTVQGVFLPEDRLAPSSAMLKILPGTIIPKETPEYWERELKNQDLNRLGLAGDMRQLDELTAQMKKLTESVQQSYKDMISIIEKRESLCNSMLIKMNSRLTQKTTDDQKFMLTSLLLMVESMKREHEFLRKVLNDSVQALGKEELASGERVPPGSRAQIDIEKFASKMSKEKFDEAKAKCKAANQIANEMVRLHEKITASGYKRDLQHQLDLGELEVRYRKCSDEASRAAFPKEISRQALQAIEDAKQQVLALCKEALAAHDAARNRRI